MALTRTFVGTTTVGASAQTPLTTRAYVKKVTVPADSVLSAIEAHLAFANGEQVAWRVGVWADNAGAVGTLLRAYQPNVNALLMGATDRWIGGPVSVWFGSATDVWIGIQIFDPGTTTLSFDSGTGSDRTVTTGSTWTGETGSAGTTVAATTNDHSIRGVVIT